MSSTIRKVEISAFGDSSNVKVVTAEIPAPGKGEVQVDVIYAGFSGSDTNMRIGHYPMQKQAPLTPGYCFVGRVSQNGPGATKFQPGDAVLGMTTYDSEAEKINFTEKFIARVPKGYDLLKAVALPLDWATAFGLIHRGAAGRVKQGARVFIHGLSGACGYALLKLCQHNGAHVYGTASERNHENLRDMGVIPFVYTDKHWIEEMTKLGGAHVIFDPLGFESFDESYKALSCSEPSILVGYGGNAASLSNNPSTKPRPFYPMMAKLLARNAAVWSSKSTKYWYIDRNQKTYMPDFEALLKMAEQGELDVVIKKVWDMDDIRQAHDSWGRQSGIGSLAIRVRNE